MWNRSARVASSSVIAASAIIAVAVIMLSPRIAKSAMISSANISPVPVGTVGSGNGTLDFILFTESAGGTTNSSGSFNGDNANTDMPTGSGHTTADESFITSIGEVRNFF